jgi:hypothetical protein
LPLSWLILLCYSDPWAREAEQHLTFDQLSAALSVQVPDNELSALVGRTQGYFIRWILMMIIRVSFIGEFGCSFVIVMNLRRVIREASVFHSGGEDSFHPRG